jgi:hypothetical protein
MDELDYLDESIDPDLDWACRMTLLEMNSDPSLINAICHEMSYEQVIRVCLFEGNPFKYGYSERHLTVARVHATTNLVFKRWKHIDKQRAAEKAADKAKSLKKQAKNQKRDKAAKAADVDWKKWRERAKQFAKDIVDAQSSKK